MKKEKPDPRVVTMKIVNCLQCPHRMSTWEKFVCGKTCGEWQDCDQWDNNEKRYIPFPKKCPLPRWEHNGARDVVALHILKALVEADDIARPEQLYQWAFDTISAPTFEMLADVERALSLFVACGIATKHQLANGRIVWYALNPDVRKIFEGGEWGEE